VTSMFCSSTGRSESRSEEKDRDDASSNGVVDGASQARRRDARLQLVDGTGEVRDLQMSVNDDGVDDGNGDCNRDGGRKVKGRLVEQESEG
jgi:hypothetical protein